ncbi:MAG: hypothetical protein AAFN70_15355, partial [Planctomycetota bacterium]
IEAGYASGDLIFTANRWGGRNNDGEFGVSGAFFTTNAGGNCSSSLMAAHDSADANSKIAPVTNPATDLPTSFVRYNQSTSTDGDDSMKMKLMAMLKSMSMQDVFVNEVDSEDIDSMADDLQHPVEAVAGQSEANSESGAEDTDLLDGIFADLI